MAKAKAPAWLREAFKDGIDDREMVYRDGVERFRKKGRPYAGANAWCWLAQFDPERLPCGGQPGKIIERFHFINRQRVEARIRELLPTSLLDMRHVTEPGDDWHIYTPEEVDELVLLAAWDPRNGGLGCEHHHRREDSHATPALAIPRSALPAHVEEFAADLGLESELERKFR